MPKQPGFWNVEERSKEISAGAPLGRHGRSNRGSGRTRKATSRARANGYIKRRLAKSVRRPRGCGWQAEPRAPIAVLLRKLLGDSGAETTQSFILGTSIGNTTFGDYMS